MSDDDPDAPAETVPAALPTIEQASGLFKKPSDEQFSPREYLEHLRSGTLRAEQAEAEVARLKTERIRELRAAWELALEYADTLPRPESEAGYEWRQRQLRAERDRRYPLPEVTP